MSADGTEAIWFLDTLVTIALPGSLGTDGISVIDNRARFGDSPPLHLHRSEDEVFHILEGEFRFRTREGEQRLGPGSTLLAPKGMPHTYRVESEGGGRWLTITTHGDFERFVRAIGRPAERNELPPPSGPPTPEQQEGLARLALQFGIEIVGPPLV